VLEKDYPELAGKIDHAKIVAAGHSYGAYTALLAGGMKLFPAGTSLADPRVKAVVAMSPPGPSANRGLTAESFAAINVPTLFMTGSRDNGMAESETPEWRSQAFELASPGDKWLIIVENARHASFIGRNGQLLEAMARERNPNMNPPVDGGFDPRNPTNVPRDPNDPTLADSRPRTRGSAESAMFRERDIFGTIKAMSLAFLDTYAKNDAKAREALEKAMTSSGVVVKKK
jgi:predicted dienelactone hydrolase